MAYLIVTVYTSLLVSCCTLKCTPPPTCVLTLWKARSGKKYFVENITQTLKQSETAHADLLICL